MAEEIKREHVYYAGAAALAGHIKLPLVQEIKPQAFAQLPAEGGYLSQHSHHYRLEGVISYHTAYTQVGGNPSDKPGQGWSTLTTSVVEGLNIMDVITADRVVAQATTEHPLEGYVPIITFLGTRFENLRIAGHPVKLELDLDILGSKPERDEAYPHDEGFLRRVHAQYEHIRSQQNLPHDLAERYNELPTSANSQESVECSLVNQASGAYPGRTFGHVIDVPDFGRIHLATVKVEHSDYKPGTKTPKQTHVSLTMVKADMGCIASGVTSVSGLTTNGHTKP